MRHVRRPDIRLDVVPWLNVIVVAWLLTLLQSNFIYAPGLAVDVDAAGQPVPGAPTRVDYPLPASIATSLTGQPMPAHRFDVQLSLANQPPSTRIEQRQFFLADGTPHYSGLPAALQKAAANTHKPPGEKPTLLLFAPANTPMDTFMKLSEIASAAGFGTVLLASRPATDADANSTGSAINISHPEQTPPAASGAGAAK
jgi:biopolymer transport protein ExbD